MTRWLAGGVGLLSVITFTAFSAGACAKRSRSGTHAAANGHAAASVPAVSSISPTSGPAGSAYPIELTIVGSNFTDSTNTVTFGPVTLKSVKSTNGGTRIVVYAPKEMPSTGEVPPMPLMIGEYAVRVVTAAGTSNAVTFNLTREP